MGLSGRKVSAAKAQDQSCVGPSRQRSNRGFDTPMPAKGSIAPLGRRSAFWRRRRLMCHSGSLDSGANACSERAIAGARMCWGQNTHLR
jgi:hypothetical protein